MRIFLDVSGGFTYNFHEAVQVFLNHLNSFIEGTVWSYDMKIHTKRPLTDYAEPDSQKMSTGLADALRTGLGGTDPDCLGDLLAGPELKIHITDGEFLPIKSPQQNVITIYWDHLVELHEIADTKGRTHPLKHLALSLIMLENNLGYDANIPV